MEIIDITRFRGVVEPKLPEHRLPGIRHISKLLASRGFVEKDAGLCAPPWDGYFSMTYESPDGVTISNSTRPVNVCYVKLNQATSTYSRKVGFCSLTITYSVGYFYLVALAQSSRYHETTGAEHVVYKCSRHELSDALDKIFEHVKLETSVQMK